jgi:hypothetical protein
MELSIADLYPGDVLLIAGHGALPRLVRMIEGIDFDHVAFVAKPNYEDPTFGSASDDDRTDELWICDIGFRGGRWIPISAYEERIASIKVRRHTLPVDGVMERAHARSRATQHYSWDRLVCMTMLGATRWTGQLANLDTADAFRVARAFFGLCTRLTETADERDSPATGLCTDLMMESFDVNARTAEQTHLGLYLVAPEHQGLLWWAAGVDTLRDFLNKQIPASEHPEVPTAIYPPTFLSTVHELATTAQSGTSSIVPEVHDEETLRCLIVDGVSRSLEQLLGVAAVEGIRGLSDPRLIAWELLDVIMKHRVITTPSDIERSPTLRFVGHLCGSFIV